MYIESQFAIYRNRFQYQRITVILTNDNLGVYIYAHKISHAIQFN